MSDNNKRFSISLLDEVNNNGAGYDVLRYIGLPNLLGKEKDTILYFMGKNMARLFAIQTMDDIIYFFEKMGWGKIELIKEKRKKLVFYLLSDSLVRRLTTTIETEFYLEAGFLAEALQVIKNVECECMFNIHHKIHQVEFTVVFTD